jgi:uncharacterized protein YecE (DUF72 family)
MSVSLAQASDGFSPFLRRRDSAAVQWGIMGSRFWVGISGYDYPGWRGRFYPKELPRRRWLEHVSRLFSSVELNGTFYSLKSPAVYERWHAETPAEGFVFAVKGSRFITHNLKLTHCETALANFYASGILALGHKTGPFLWQLPATYAFDPRRIEAFAALLPRDSREAEALARGHDARLRGGTLVEAPARVPYRHALEPRHPSYFHRELYDLLRRLDLGFVVADTAGRYSVAHEITADFAYVRLHGSQELYVSGYADEELDVWATRVRGWAASGVRDVYIYFDNDAKVHAPHDALRLAQRLELTTHHRDTREHEQQRDMEPRTRQSVRP